MAHRDASRCTRGNLEGVSHRKGRHQARLPLPPDGLKLSECEPREGPGLPVRRVEVVHTGGIAMTRGTAPSPPDPTQLRVLAHTEPRTVVGLPHLHFEGGALTRRFIDRE